MAACSNGTGSTTTVFSPTANSTTTTPADPVTTTAPNVTTTAEGAETTAPATIPPVTGIDEYPVPGGSRPHDVAPGPDGTMWYTGQSNGTLGRLDPLTGDVDEIPLGNGAAPHGVITGPDGAPWVTDQGLNAIVRVDPETSRVEVFTSPVGQVGMHTAAFDHDGVLWFTGQAGFFGRFDPATTAMEVYPAPGGGGPYGITVTPSNEVFYASLARSHIARVERSTGEAEVIEPPTPGQGARRVWSDSQGTVWVAEWNSGQVSAYDPATGDWRQWRLPGDSPQAYAVYVDETDRIWLTDFAGDGALVRFDPSTETFESFPLPTPGGIVRQLLGLPGQVWGAQSAADSLIVIRFGG